MAAFIPIAHSILSSIFGGNDNSAEMAALRRQNEGLQQQLAQLQTKLSGLMAEIKNQGITSLDDLKVKDKARFDSIVKLAGAVPAMELTGVCIGFFGVISTGKSSLINALRGLTDKNHPDYAKVGLGEITSEYKLYPGINLNYVDVPGKHDRLGYFTADYVSLVKGLKLRVVLVQESLRLMASFIDFLLCMKLPFVIVVSRYDITTEGQDASEVQAFDDTIRKEINELCPGTPVFKVSSKFPARYQFAEFVQHITNVK